MFVKFSPIPIKTAENRKINTVIYIYIYIYIYIQLNIKTHIVAPYTWGQHIIINYHIIN